MSFKRILLPLDRSSIAEQTIAHAKVMAQTSDVQIYLLHVFNSHFQDGDVTIDSVDWRLRTAEVTSYLKRLAEGLAAEGIACSFEIREGRPAEQIVEFSDEHEIDLVIFSAYGRGGVTQFSYGSTVQKAMSRTNASFMILRPDEYTNTERSPSYHRVLVPMDGTQRSEWAACQTAAILEGQPAEIILLQVIAIPDMPRRMPLTQEERMLREKFVECNRRVAKTYLDDIAHQLQNGLKVRTRLVVAKGVVRQINVIAEEEQVDLIAMCAHGLPDDASRVSGSTCQAVVANSSRPVLVFQDLPDSTPRRLQSADEPRQSSQLFFPDHASNR